MTKKTESQTPINQAITFFWYCLYFIKENPLWLLLILSNLVAFAQATQANEIKLTAKDNNNNDFNRTIPINDFTREYFEGGEVSEEVLTTKVNNIWVHDAVHYGNKLYDFILGHSTNETIQEILVELKNSTIDPNVIFKTAVRNAYTIHKTSNPLPDFFGSVKELYDIVLAQDEFMGFANQYNAAYYIATKQPKQAMKAAKFALKSTPSVANERLYGIAKFLSDPNNAYTAKINQLDYACTQLFDHLLYFIDQRLLNRFTLIVRKEVAKGGYLELLDELIQQPLNKQPDNNQPVDESYKSNDPYFSFEFSRQVMAKSKATSNWGIMHDLANALFLDPLNRAAIEMMLHNPNSENPQFTFSLYRYMIILASDVAYYNHDINIDNTYYEVDPEIQSRVISGATWFLETHHEKLQSDWFTDKKFKKSFQLSLDRATREGRNSIAEALEKYLALEEEYLRVIQKNEQMTRQIYDLSITTSILFIMIINFINPYYFNKSMSIVKDLAGKALTASMRFLLRFKFIRNKLSSILLNNDSDHTGPTANTRSASIQSIPTDAQYQNFLSELVTYREAFILGINEHYPYNDIRLDGTNDIMKEFIEDLEKLISKSIEEYQRNAMSNLGSTKPREVLYEQLDSLKKLTEVAPREFLKLIDKKQLDIVAKINKEFNDTELSMAELKEKFTVLINKMIEHDIFDIDLTRSLSQYEKIEFYHNNKKSEFNSILQDFSLNNEYEIFKNIAIFATTFLEEKLENILKPINDIMLAFEKEIYEEKFRKLQLQKEHSSVSQKSKKEKWNPGFIKPKKVKAKSNKDKNPEPAKDENTKNPAPLTSNLEKPTTTNLANSQSKLSNENGSNPVETKNNPPENSSQNNKNSKPVNTNLKSTSPEKSTLHDKPDTVYTLEELQNDNALLRLKDLYRSITFALNNLPHKSTIESQPILFYGLLANLMWFYSAMHISAKRFSSVAALIDPKEAAEMKNIIFYRRLSFYTLDDLNSILDITHKLMIKINIFTSEPVNIFDINLAKKIHDYVVNHHTSKKPASQLSLKEVMSNLIARFSHLEFVYNNQPNEIETQLNPSAKCLIWTTIAQEIYALPKGLKMKVLLKLNLILTHDPMDDTKLESFRNANRHVKLDNTTIITGNIIFKITNYFGMLGDTANNMTNELFSDEKALKIFLGFLKNVFDTCKEVTPGITNFHTPIPATPPSTGLPDFDPNASNNNNDAPNQQL